MKVTTWRYFEGPNVHAHRPVIEAILDLEDLAGRFTKDIPPFADLICQDFEGLLDHHCGLGRRGGFRERLVSGTMFGHVVEHVALELEHLAGCDVTWGRTREVERDRVFRVVFEAPGQTMGEEALFTSLAWVDARAKGDHFDGEARRLEAVDRLQDKHLGPTARAVWEAARSRAIPVRRLGDNSVLELGWGVFARRAQASITDHTGVIGVEIAADKALTKRLLKDAFLPVPPGAVVEKVEDGLQAADAIGWPVVTKPLDGNQGAGVSLALRTRGEFRRAFSIAHKVAKRVMVERHIEGRHLRVLVVCGKVVAAAERFPAAVRGDGRHSIEELVDIANAQPERGRDHSRPLTRIYLDDVVRMSLRRRGLDLASVPPAGSWVLLRESANLSTGGEAEDATDDVGEEIKEAAVRAAAVVGIDVAGVDLVVEDLGHIGSGAILEVNACPGLRMHEHPSRGAARKTGGAIVRALFPEGDGRIPLVAVTGTNGKSTTARLIAHIISGTGRTVGLTTTDGIQVGGRLVAKGDSAGPKSGRAVLQDSRVEAAVLEVARGGILRGGLAYDRADVGVFTNLSADHLGLSGIDDLEALAHVKSLVVEAVHPHGASVLNADDERVRSLAPRCGGEVVFFSRHGDAHSVRSHLASGGRAVFVRGRQVVCAQGELEETLGEARDLPFTFGGQSRVMVENALAALAAAWGLGIAPARAFSLLSTFAGGEDANPGRFNLHALGDLQVMLDYGHNAAAIEAAIETARLLKPQRLVGIVGIPGDRRDEDARLLAEVAAKGFDRLVLKEDKDLRGRQPGEMLSLLERFARGAKGRARNVELVADEAEALHLALLTGLPGDLIVAFYEHLEPLADVIREVERQLAAPLEQVTV